MKKELIGANAGIVWRVLNTRHDKMFFGELLMATQLNPIELTKYFSPRKTEKSISLSIRNVTIKKGSI